MDRDPAALCLGKPALRMTGDNWSDLSSKLCSVLMEPCGRWWGRSVDGGGGGGCLGAMKSPLATDLLGADAVGRLVLRGGGWSTLVRTDEEFSREAVDGASNEIGKDEVEALRSWPTDMREGMVDGVASSGVGGMGLRTPAVKESPRAGLSACFAGACTVLVAVPPPRFGSLNGLTSSFDAVERGDTAPSFSVRSGVLLSMYEGSDGDLGSLLELEREPVFFDCGTSCNLKPSLEIRLEEDPAVSIGCGFDRSILDSCGVAMDGDADDDPVTGVLGVDVSHLVDCLPFSWYRIWGLGLEGTTLVDSWSVDRDLERSGRYSSRGVSRTGSLVDDLVR